MARDPRHRFASAEAFAWALRAAVPPSDVRLPWTTAAGTSGTRTAPAVAAATLEVGAEPTRPTETFGPRPPRLEARRARWRAVVVAGAAATVPLWALLLWALRAT